MDLDGSGSAILLIQIVTVGSQEFGVFHPDPRTLASCSFLSHIIPSVFIACQIYIEKFSSVIFQYYYDNKSLSIFHIYLTMYGT